jgi:hypothetical protein
VVLDISLDLGVISQPMFTLLVIIGIVITTPALRRSLPRAGVALQA